jgi:UDP-2,4-diacetamido-2,4,6-trideoxy-beta-L-altropyranose hydrolase
MLAAVILRADAGPGIGVGHVMRSLTLGRALAARNVDTALASLDLPAALHERAARLGVRVVGVDDVPSNAFVMVDGYEIPAPAGAYGVIDDNHEAPVADAALVVNQNLHATEAMYADVPSSTRLLLGPQYALLREELLPCRATQPVRADANRVVVAMGGSDPRGLTEPIVRALGEDPHLELRVAIGAANPRRTALETCVAQLGGRGALDTGDLVDSFRWADLAVIAAGTTLWEVAYIGLPAVAVVVADNQVAAAKASEAEGFVVCAGADGVAGAARALLRDASRRAAMRAAGQPRFDGLGPARVADAILQLLGIEGTGG